MIVWKSELRRIIFSTNCLIPLSNDLSSKLFDDYLVSLS